MAKKYRRVHRPKSRLEAQQAKKVMRQTYLIIATTIILIVIIIVIGIPALIKIAVFLGDIRGSSTPIEQTDTIAPAVPQLTTPPSATTSARINIYGFAESGTTVILYQNNAKTNEALTQENGSFEFISIKLDSGINRFSAKAVDLAGNESPSSPIKSVNFDSSAPDITITSPSDGQHFFGHSEQTITVTGTTDPTSTVKINSRLALVNSSGEFTLDIQLSEGDNTIEATSTDTAGNSSTQKIIVKYSR